MTELERARAHLRYCQDALATYRRNGIRYLVPGTEACVLAALSWVWEEQERLSFAGNDAAYAEWATFDCNAE